MSAKSRVYTALLSGLIFLASQCGTVDTSRKKDIPETTGPETIGKEQERETVSPKETIMDNVNFESIDRGNPDAGDDTTVYYKIYINKELTAKTSSGLFFQRKKLALNLEPGRYHFFAERWYLDENAEEEIQAYRRANNVWQMKPVYIDVPEPPGVFKMVFGINHDTKEFYYEIEGQKLPVEESPSDDTPDGNE